MIGKEDEFMWYLYLEATNSEAVPDVLFKHVEKALESDISIGMVIEVPIKSKDNKVKHYWVATVTMVCGPLLELQYFGCEDKSHRIWFNLAKDYNLAKGRELVSYFKDKKSFSPPTNSKIAEGSAEKLETFIRNSNYVSADVFRGRMSMMTRIKKGMKVEIADPLNPYKLWMATVKRNYGGRLLLKYDTPGNPNKKENLEKIEKEKEYWTYCTSELIHDYGFLKKCSSPWFLEPPASIKSKHSSDEWIDLATSYSLNNQTSDNLFANEKNLAKHSFKVGMKLEAISPCNNFQFHPATVTKVFDDTYFLVSIDETVKDIKRTDICSDINKTDICSDINKTWLCTVDHPYIFPKNWAKRHNIKLILPSGWTSFSEYFDWDKYLLDTDSVAADEFLFSNRENAAELGYKVGMRLEAVSPLNVYHVCAAQIRKIVDDLLFIKIESEDNQPEHIYHIHSPMIFPIGWCESNKYHLKFPRNYKQTIRNYRAVKEDIPRLREKTNFTKIYFNTRCATGPLISKSKLTALPKSMGPGPVELVVKEVLTMLVNIGYNVGRVLKFLQFEGPLLPGYSFEMLKVKTSNKRYHASVVVVTDSALVEDFCRETCIKLSVCPSLFGPIYIPDHDQCPQKCRKSRGRGKSARKRGRQSNKDKNAIIAEREGGREEESTASDTSRNTPERMDEDGNEVPRNVTLNNQLLNNSDDVKNDQVTSDTSESSNNERLKLKESNGDSSSAKSFASKDVSPGLYGKRLKRLREPENNPEMGCLDYIDPEYAEIHRKRRRPKVLRLDKSPLDWTIDEVYNYLRKTNDCKEIAELVKAEEVDGLAFMLLNLPSMLMHMKLDKSEALKLCRHVEQVKLTYFMRHAHDVVFDV